GLTLSSGGSVGRPDRPAIVVLRPTAVPDGSLFSIGGDGGFCGLLYIDLSALAASPVQLKKDIVNLQSSGGFDGLIAIRGPAAPLKFPKMSGGDDNIVEVQGDGSIRGGVVLRLENSAAQSLQAVELRSGGGVRYDSGRVGRALAARWRRSVPAATRWSRCARRGEGEAGVRLLIIEDDRTVGESLARGLARAGHAVDMAADGRDGLARAESGAYDAILLDLGLPGLGGLELLQALRAGGRSVPVIVITARDRLADRVSGLDAGADDYLVKPFALEEVLARLRAVLRRRGPVLPPRLACGDLELDAPRRRALRGGKPLALTRREYAILEYFLRNPGVVLTRAMIAQNVWADRLEGLSNVIDVHVGNLRKKLDALGPPLIHTVRGAGYLLGPEG
ncbi:MAG TPA: response regulator transcription factor, partial [Planctomycetota bacterium]|nr:response regulator transcription factor [Planctomycetota bacterium]